MKKVVQVFGLVLASTAPLAASAAEVPGFCGGRPWQFQAGCPEASWWNTGEVRQDAAIVLRPSERCDANAWVLQLNAEQDGLPETTAGVPEDGQEQVLAINRANDGLNDDRGNSDVVEGANWPAEVAEVNFGIDGAFAGWVESVNRQLGVLEDTVVAGMRELLSRRSSAAASLGMVRVYQPPTYDDAEAGAVLDDAAQQWIADPGVASDPSSDIEAVREVARTALRDVSAVGTEGAGSLRDEASSRGGWDCVYPGCAAPSPGQAVGAPSPARDLPYLGL